MVSRRRILGRSQDNLNVDLPYMEDEDDVWYKTEKLLKDHITEVLMKWEQIDDEIWAKVIVLESNRRVAKAYARVPVLTVNGSDDGFDGYRIGLCGFENPMRDPRTDEVKRHIGQGVKLKMDDQGNILIKRVSKAGVYVKITSDDNAISNEILKLPNCCLESERPVMLFDMNKFQQNVNREMRRQYPDRSKLELQCVCVIAFVKNESDLLDCPIWVMIINIVAMDMLKSKLPPAKVAPNIRNRPRIPIPDEDPYSVAGSGASSGSSGKDRKDKPPKLPPRDNPHYPPGHVPRSNGKSDYDVLDENAFRKSHTRNNKSKDRKYDDPYYCGLRAHIPNFAKAKSKGKVEPARAPYLNAPPPPMWHTRSFDSGMGKAPSTPPPLPPTSSHPHYPLYAHHSNNSSNSHRRQQQQQTLTRHQQQQQHQHYHQLTHHHHHHPHHQYRHHAHAYSTMNLTMKSRSMSPPPGSPTEETYLALSAPPPLPHWIPQPSLPHHGVSSPQSLPLYIGSHPPLYSDDDDYVDREHDNDGDEEDAGDVGRKG